MIKVNVKCSGAPLRTVMIEAEKTPNDVLNELSIDTSGAKVNLDGTPLDATKMETSFEALGIEDGGTVRLNSVVKSDDGNN